VSREDASVQLFHVDNYIYVKRIVPARNRELIIKRSQIGDPAEKFAHLCPADPRGNLVNT